MYKCQNLCLKNQDIYLLKIYTSVPYFGSIYIYIYIEIEMCVFMENSVLVSFSPQDFHIIPGGVCYLPGETFTTRSHPGNFFEI